MKIGVQMVAGVDEWREWEGEVSSLAYVEDGGVSVSAQAADGRLVVISLDMDEAKGIQSCIQDAIAGGSGGTVEPIRRDRLMSILGRGLGRHGRSA